MARLSTPTNSPCCCRTSTEISARQRWPSSTTATTCDDASSSGKLLRSSTAVVCRRSTSPGTEANFLPEATRRGRVSADLHRLRGRVQRQSYEGAVTGRIDEAGSSGSGDRTPGDRGGPDGGTDAAGGARAGDEAPLGDSETVDPEVAAEGDIIRGYFTRALLDALSGAAARPGGGVTGPDLKAYLERRVPELADADGYVQKPRVPHDFPEDEPIVFGSARPSSAPPGQPSAPARRCRVRRHPTAEERPTPSPSRHLRCPAGSARACHGA